MQQLSYKELEVDVAKCIDAMFPKKNCFIEVLPGNVILPRKFMEIGEAIRNLETYEDDVWLVSYPRTGSTWAQEMIWLLGNKLDYEGARRMQQARSPLIELSALFSEDHYEWVSNSIGNTVDAVRNMKRPRFARSHLPLCLLPKDLQTSKAKIIYTARNPKDLCISFYYYCKLIHGLQGTLEQFLDLFLKDATPMGSYWKHVIPFWERRNQPNFLFLKYEDMKRDIMDTVQKCANFLHIDYELTDASLKAIHNHLKFDAMQINPAVNLDPLLNKSHGNVNFIKLDDNNTVNKFIRKGYVGDWKNHISEKASQHFDQWIEQHSIGVDLSFVYQ